jgi:hypothetical protein
MDEWFKNLNLPQAIVVCVAIIGVVWLLVG